MSQIEIIGKYRKDIYRNESNQYTIGKFRLYEIEERDITITGYLPLLHQDILYRLFGSYKEHHKYGLQFEVARFEQVLPSDQDSIISFLSGSLFPGIGKKLAEKLVEQYGNEVLDKIKENPELLNLVKGMNDKKKQIIMDGLAQNGDLEETMRFFTTHGIGIRNIMKLDQIYGKEVLEVVRRNPYQLVEDVDGIGFGTADKLAMSMNFDTKSNYRNKAALFSLIMDLCMNSGDSYVTYAELRKPLVKRLGHDEFELDYLIALLKEEKKINQEQDRIYHASQFEAENGIALFFQNFTKKPPLDLDDEVIETLLAEIERKENITYEAKQKEAISLFIKLPFFILTGGPGTGKSTIVKAMVELYQRLYPHQMIALCAPTGRASKRLSELTGAEASTIHRLLKWNLETNTFGMNEESLLPYDLLIVDEFSMVDNWMLHQLIRASGTISKIVFIGDEDQLPSVACGFALRDFIASHHFPVVRLEKIYRQKEGSDVVTLAHNLKQQKESDFSLMHDVKFYDTSLFEVKDRVVQIVGMALEKGYDMSEIQVLAPKYDGQAGITMLNHYLQRLCNPPSPFKNELQIGNCLFREGDKILQLKNQPDDDIYNGDIGVLQDILLASEDFDRKNRMVVNFDGIIVEYTADTFYHLKHAYCISIHKSQGSEYPIVIMPIVHEYYHMLCKRLIYTGITRAKKSLILLGERSAYEHGIQTRERKERLTTLTHRFDHVFSLHEEIKPTHPITEE